MGGIRVDGDTQMSTLPGSSPAGRSGGGTARRQPPRRQLAVGSDRLRQARRRVCRRVREKTGGAAIDERRSSGRGAALAPFDRGRPARTRTPSSTTLQDMMQDLVGIVRRESECARRWTAERPARARARAGIGGNREYNAGWHTAIDLPNLLTFPKRWRAAIERKESRGAQFRDDYPRSPTSSARSTS
jgi:succinate dehydrogenase / fumarate reductase flavoprotein subunit